jgi:hypothetical protein
MVSGIAGVFWRWKEMGPPAPLPERDRLKLHLRLELSPQGLTLLATILQIFFWK